MTDNRKSGIALIAGSLCGAITMILHPHGTYHPMPEQARELVVHAGIAHTFAMAASLLIFLGLAALTTHMHRTPRTQPSYLSLSAMIIFAFACVALLIATAIDGFVLPKLMMHMASDSPDTLQTHRLIIEGMFQINQTFAAIYSVTTAAAIFLWSLAAFRNNALGRFTSLYGLISMPLLSLLIAVGHLRLSNVHGMAIVVVVQSVWFLLVAGEMLTKSYPLGYINDGVAAV